jgi:TonB family protein
VLLHKVEPRDTEQARAAKVEGTVLLKVEVEETGMVSKDQIRVVRRLGYGLDEAAVECVRQWRFKPAFKNGYAAKSAASIEVNFRP